MKKITLFLLIAVMAAAMVIPASAASDNLTYEVVSYKTAEFEQKALFNQIASYCNIPDSLLKASSRISITQQVCLIDGADGLYVSEIALDSLLSTYCSDPSAAKSLINPSADYVLNDYSPLYFTGITDYSSYGLNFYDHGYSCFKVVYPGPLGFLGEDSFTPLFDEIISLLPVILVCVVSFIGIRKGIDFLIGFLHKS